MFASSGILLAAAVLRRRDRQLPAVQASRARACRRARSMARLSPATGIAADGPIADEDLFGRRGISLAEPYPAPWAEAGSGLRSGGVASLLDARPPTVLQRVSAFSPGLDPSGLVVTRARNDVHGAFREESLT